MEGERVTRLVMMKLMVLVIVITVVMMGGGAEAQGVPICCRFDPSCCNRFRLGVPKP